VHAICLFDANRPEAVYEYANIRK